MAVKQRQGLHAPDSSYYVTLVDGDGNLSPATAGSGGTASVDDSAFSAASGSGTPMMGFVTSDSVDSGDVGVVGMLDNRQLKVTLFDSSGVEQAVGGGTQYIEDDAAAANPTGNAIVVVRDDARGGSLTSANGDNVALRGTNSGEVYVKHVDAIPVTDNSGSLTVDGTVTVQDGGSTISIDDGAGSITVDGTVTIQDGGNTITVDNGGTFATQATLQTGDNTVGRVKLTDGTDVADILDLSNSNPLTVAIVDASGDQITSFGGGTQYTEDAAAAANPTGTALNLVRDDARAGSLTSADGDNVSARGTNAGELYVKHVDAIPVTDNGGALTVDGTVAATQSGTWNIADITGTVSLPTGAATSANQSTMITSLQLIDDTVFAEDVAAQAADKGVSILAVRRDADTSLVGTDNDYAQLQVDANGALKVEIFDGGGSHTVDDGGSSITVDNAGTFATQATLQTGDNTVGRVKLTDGTDVADVLDLTNSNPLTVAVVDANGSQITSFGGSGGTSEVDDAAFTAATDSGTPIMGFVTSDSVDSGDVGVLGMLANRQLKVTLFDSSGVELSVGGGTQYTEDAAAAANPVGTALNMVRDDARAGSLTSADGDNVAARGTNAGELYVKHVDAIPVTDNGGALTVDNGGTFAVQDSTVATNTGNSATSLALIDDTVFAEDVAAQAADKGIAILAVRRDADTSLVGTDNDYANLQVNANGALKVEIFDGGDSHTVDGTVTIQDGGGAITVDNGGTFAVQESGSALTALQLIDDTVFAEDTAAQAADKGLAILAVRRDADTTLVGTDNDYANLQVDANGALKVEIFDGGGSHTVDNGGTFAVQESGSALTALQVIDNTILVDDAAFSVGSTSVNIGGYFADDASTDSVDEGDVGAARMTLDRKAVVNPQPYTRGGLTIFRSLDLDESEEEIKGTRGQVYSCWVTNTATTTRFLKFYNATAANVTVGSTTPVITIAIPGNTSDDVSGVFTGGGYGIEFDTAITVAATTGVADADTGAPAANDVIVNIFYS